MDNEQLFREALEAGRRRDYVRAVSLLTALVGRTDRFPSALLYLGRAHHALGHYPQAVQSLQFYLKTQPDSLPGRFFLARAYLGLDMPARAAGLLRVVAEADPEFTAARGLLGYALLKLRRPFAAVRHLAEAVRLDPGDHRLRTAYVNALLVKGIRLFKFGRLAEAEPVLREVVLARPDAILAHLYLGRLCNAAGRPESAFEHYDQASSLAPDDPAFPLLKAVISLGTGDAETAARELDRMTGLMRIQRRLPHDPQFLLRILAVSLLQNGRHREVVRYGKMALRNDYHDADLHAVVAEALFHLGDHERARNHYERAIQYGASRPEPYYGLAVSLWHLGEYERLRKVSAGMLRRFPGDAAGTYFRVLARSETELAGPELISEIQNAIRVSGPDPQLMASLGKAYMDVERPDLSVGWLERAHKLEPSAQIVVLRLIEVYRELDREDALTPLYSLALDRQPDDDDLRREFVRHLLRRESYEEAASQILALLPRHPGSRALRKSLAQCYMMTESYGQAAVLYRELLREEPRSLSLLRSLVLCLDRMGHHAVAVDLLQKASSYIKDNAEVLLPLGVLHIKLAQYAEAQEVFRRVLAIEPRNWRAYHNLARACRKAGQTQFADRFSERARSLRREEESRTGGKS